MNKLKNFFKIGFYSLNIILIILYLFPGSILGCFLYNDCYIQPQITRDFIISSNHVYVFIVLSTLGIIAYQDTKKIKILKLKWIKTYNFHKANGRHKIKETEL